MWMCHLEIWERTNLWSIVHKPPGLWITHTHRHTHTPMSNSSSQGMVIGGSYGADGWWWRALGISSCPAGSPSHDLPSFDPISRWMRRWTSVWQGAPSLAHMSLVCSLCVGPLTSRLISPHICQSKKYAILHQTSCNTPIVCIKAHSTASDWIADLARYRFWHLHQ